MTCSASETDAASEYSPNEFSVLEMYPSRLEPSLPLTWITLVGLIGEQVGAAEAEDEDGDEGWEADVDTTEEDLEESPKDNLPELERNELVAEADEADEATSEDWLDEDCEVEEPSSVVVVGSPGEALPCMRRPVEFYG